MRLVKLWLNNFKLVSPNTKYQIPNVGPCWLNLCPFKHVFSWLCQPPSPHPLIPFVFFFKTLNPLYINYGIWYGSMGLMVLWFCDSVVLCIGGEGGGVGLHSISNIRAYIYFFCTSSSVLSLLFSLSLLPLFYSPTLPPRPFPIPVLFPVSPFLTTLALGFSLSFS